MLIEYTMTNNKAYFIEYLSRDNLHDAAEGRQTHTHTHTQAIIKVTLKIKPTNPIAYIIR